MHQDRSCIEQYAKHFQKGITSFFCAVNWKKHIAAVRMSNNSMMLAFSQKKKKEKELNSEVYGAGLCQL